MEAVFHVDMVSQLDRLIEQSDESRILEKVYLTPKEFDALVAQKPSDLRVDDPNGWGPYSCDDGLRKGYYRGVRILEQKSKGEMICG